jgi:hypothetical protein
MMRCPGQDLRFWKLGDIFDVPCPQCGMAIEFWKDEPGVKCPQCGRVIVNPRLDLGCAQWCQHAEECLGSLIDPQSLLCKKLIKEMKIALGPAERTIDHALAVFRNAQQILAGEPADARVVSAAAILHPLVGPCPAPETPRTGPPPGSAELSGVHEILARCGVDTEQTARICQLIAPRDGSEREGSMEARVLQDAERLARLADPSTGPGAAREQIIRTLQTPTARALANLLTDPDQKPPEQAGRSSASNPG